MTEPLFDVFRAAMLRNPDGSRKEARDEFIARMKADPIYLELLAGDYFERMAAVWIVRDENIGRSLARTEISQDKIERLSVPKSEHPRPALEIVRRTKDEASARTAAMFAEMKTKVRGVILLDLLMPDGKALRNATGAECAKAGGFYAEVAKSIKATQVVDRHLSEADLQNIRARFYQAKRGVA